MKEKILLLYDLKGKTQVKKVQLLRKMFGYKDKSNYNYQYERFGELSGIKLSRSKKSVIELQNEKDLVKVAKILKKLKINFEIAKTQN